MYTFTSMSVLFYSRFILIMKTQSMSLGFCSGFITVAIPRFN